MLDVAVLSGSGSGRILGVEGVSIAMARGTLPGIRVGEGEGAGYVVVREIDGQLVFVPDAGFTGTAAFTCTVESETGEQTTYVSRVRVEAATSGREQITFANGSRQASVVEGTDAAIIGALTISETGGLQLPDIRVYEQAADAPSERFVVAGGRLKAVQPLDRSSEGVIHLRIDAYEDAFVFASSSFAIEIVPAARSDSSAAAIAAIAPQLSLAYSAPGPEREASTDAFMFVVESGPSQPDVDDVLEAFSEAAGPLEQVAGNYDGTSDPADAGVVADMPLPDGPDSFGV